MKTMLDDMYKGLLSEILFAGHERMDRTGVGTRAVFCKTLQWDMSFGFPAISIKKLAYKTAWKEMLWMLSGSTSLRDLLRQNVHIWTAWAYEKYKKSGGVLTEQEFEQEILRDEPFNARWGDLGPIYGKQWRRWKTVEGREVDQVGQVVELLKSNPSSRRILWEGWNVGELEQMALPPCHKHYQFFVRGDVLDAALIQRSADAFLGLPFNLCNLGLVTHMLAEQVGLRVGVITWVGLDVHLYSNHLPAVTELVRREARSAPKLVIHRKPASIFAYTVSDFSLEGYDPHPALKAEVAV